MKPKNNSIWLPANRYPSRVLPFVPSHIRSPCGVAETLATGCAGDRRDRSIIAPRTFLPYQPLTLALAGILLTLLALPVRAQTTPWNTNGSGIRYAPSGVNVGIGTLSPGATFQIGGFSGTASSTTFRAGSSNLGSTAGSDINMGSCGFATGNMVSLGIHAFRASSGSDFATTAIGLGVGVDNTTRVNNLGSWFHANGNVGIGTTSPQTSLHVVSSTDSVVTIESAISTQAWPRLVFKTDARQWEISTGNSATSSAVAGKWYVYGRTTGGLAGIRMLIDSSGNVGIGTNAPQHMLHVAGVIGAEQIIVSSNGADYVFSPDYHLAPLTDVADYIQEYHRLPGIPSAEDMQAHGLNLGEVQTKLLAKVEELTLHVIESNERNDKLQRQNDELQTRISRLEAGLARVSGP